LDEKSRLKIVAGADLIVSIFILITGMYVIYFGLSFNGYIDTIRDYIPHTVSTDWILAIPWIIFMIGLTTMIYSIKRLIDNISRLFVI